MTSLHGLPPLASSGVARQSSVSLVRDVADRRSGARTPGAGARIRLAAMSPSSPAWTVVGVLLAAAATALLIHPATACRRSRHRAWVCLLSVLGATLRPRGSCGPRGRRQRVENRLKVLRHQVQARPPFDLGFVGRLGAPGTAQRGERALNLALELEERAAIAGSWSTVTLGGGFM